MVGADYQRMVHVRLGMSDGALRKKLLKADVVAFDRPLSDRHRQAIRDRLDERPQLAVYAWGRYAEPIDADLTILDGLEATQELSLNLVGLKGLTGLERFADLRHLTISRSTKRHSLAALGAPGKLESLTIDGPLSGLEVLRTATALRTLTASSTPAVMQAILGLPCLERVELIRGSQRDLAALATLPVLRDLNLWSVQGLDADDLAALQTAPGLRALSLGPARNVRTLEWIRGLRSTLTYLAFEGLPALDTLDPIEDLHHLRAFGSWDTRTADTSLRALHHLPLTDVVAARFPEPELDALRRALPHARIGPEDSELTWRRLLQYVDEDTASQPGP